METDSHIFYLLILIPLLVLTVFLSGSETAFLSLSDFDQKDLKRRATKRSLRVLILLSNSKSLLVSLKLALIVVNTTLICLGIPISKLFADALNIPFGFALIIVVGFIIITLFIINEFWTNLIVLSKNQGFAEFVSFPIMLYFKMSFPLANSIAKILTYLSQKYDVLNKSSFLSSNKIMAMVENGNEVSDLEDSERAMIHSIFEFSETEVHEIMVPRIDMICVEKDIDLEELIKLIIEKGHSRIPLFSESIDNILGIIHAKDLLQVIDEMPEKVALNNLARPAYFVPESKKLHYLLKEFQQEKSHMAIVVDEYGGTAGLVTLEDVIEEIVGDIQDEYDEEPPLYRKLDDNTFLVDAKIDLHDLNEILELDLPTEGEYESLGGFILNLTGYVPEEKEVVKYNSYKFVVEEIDRNRIVLVKMSKNRDKLESEIDSNQVET